MTSGRALSLRFLPILLLGGLVALAFGGEALAAPAIPSPAGDGIVISEFSARGSEPGLEESDEFVELFNPTTNDVVIGGWLIRSISNSGAMNNIYTFPPGSVIESGGHYLVVGRGYNGIVAGDDYLNSGGIPEDADIPGDGGVALVNGALEIDRVGTDPDAAEGTPLPILLGDIDQGYERGPGGDNGNCTDTNDNLVDFAFLSPSDPQNSLSPLTVACLPAPVQTRTFTPTFTATSTPNLPWHMVISEIRARGLNGEEDELVELFNPTGNSVNLGGWQVWKSSGCGMVTSRLFTIPSDTWLYPGRHFLAASENASLVILPDLVYSDQWFDNGGLALLNASLQVVDEVGLCATTGYLEGDPLLRLSADLNQGYERALGGLSGSCQDGDDNLADFIFISASSPQNMAGSPQICPGILTSTPTRTPSPTRTATPTNLWTRTFTPTASRTITPSATRTRTRTSTNVPTAFPGNVVINEYLPRPASDWNGDGEVNSRDEYIELINMGTTNINIRSWALDDLPEDGSAPYTFLDLTLAPRQIIRLYASETGISLSDGGDTVRLLKPDGRTADLHFYRVLTVSDTAWCRLPDGSGAWAFICRPTPGRPNARLGTGDPGPIGGNSPAEVLCFLPDTAPQAFWLGECDAPGGNIWRRWSDWELRLNNRWKWDLHME